MAKYLIFAVLFAILLRSPVSYAGNRTEEMIELDVIKAFENSDASEVLAELEEDNILDTTEEASDDEEDVEQDEEEDNTDNADDMENDSSKSSITERDANEKSSLQGIFTRRQRPQRPPVPGPEPGPRPPNRPPKPWRHPCCKQRHALRCKVRKLRKEKRHLRRLIAKLDRKIIWYIIDCTRRFRPNKRKISFCIRYRLKKHFHSSCHCRCGKY